MTPEEREALRRIAMRAMADLGHRRWHLQTSNSWHRIGTDNGDGNVLHPTVHHRDGHPDLNSAMGVLEYIIATQPVVLLELLSHIDAIESRVPDSACPCVHTKPCSLNCTCRYPTSSSGCTRCCSYGSPEEQRAAAERLAADADFLDRMSKEFNERHR